MQMLHQAKQNQMQRDPSDMDGNRQRPGSPGSSENAPSPSKRPRLDGAPFNPNQPGMVPNGAQRQGMPGPQVGNAHSSAQAQAAQMLLTNGINPSQLTPQQFSTFSNQPPQVQAKSIATYAANLQQHQASQMPNKSMPNASGPQGQGSPMMQQVPDQAALTAYYNTQEMGPGGMRPGPGGPGGPQAGGGSNHALQDYQMQLMLLEQQNKKRLMMARQEQDNMGGMPRGDGPPGAGGPGPNGQPFPESSPQGARTGASPNPADQMKRGTPQMNNAGIPSPLPEGAQSRGSPINFMPNTMDPTMAPNFFTKEMQNMGGNMVPNPQMNGMRPPSSHPGQPFNGQMTPQMMAAARQQQQQQQQAQGGNPQVQWQQGPNGQMVPGQPGPVPGGQRSMPPPSAPAVAAANAGRTNTSSPQQPAAPPTPSQTNKAAPKKKDSKASKSKVSRDFVTCALSFVSDINWDTGCKPKEVKLKPQRCRRYTRRRDCARGRGADSGHAYDSGQRQRQCRELQQERAKRGGSRGTAPSSCGPGPGPRSGGTCSPAPPGCVSKRVVRHGRVRQSQHGFLRLRQPARFERCAQRL